MLVDTRICFTAKLLLLHHSLTVVHTECVLCGTVVLNVSSKKLLCRGILLTAADCVFCRSFATPPLPVQIVCECVALLRGQKDPDWKVVKGIMAETNFLHSLQTLAVDDITMGQVNHTPVIIRQYTV